VLTLVPGLAARFPKSGPTIASDVARVDAPLVVAAARLVLRVPQPAVARGTGLPLRVRAVAYTAYALVPRGWLAPEKGQGR
jgi:hypothetical protein